jgi:hypothetical protein
MSTHLLRVAMRIILPEEIRMRKDKMALTHRMMNGFDQHAGKN